MSKSAGCQFWIMVRLINEAPEEALCLSLTNRSYETLESLLVVKQASGMVICNFHFPGFYFSCNFFLLCCGVVPKLQTFQPTKRPVFFQYNNCSMAVFNMELKSYL